MEIQFNGAQSFLLKGKKVKCIFDPEENFSEDVGFAMFSGQGADSKVKRKKDLRLPGEFEIAGALIQGFYTDDNSNVVYKVLLEDVAVISFGAMKQIPEGTFFEGLGDTVDVALINLSSDFDEKKAKELIEKVEPRMVILGGDNAYFPKMVENAGAKNREDNPLKISKSSLSDEKTEVVILSVQKD